MFRLFVGCLLALGLWFGCGFWIFCFVFGLQLHLVWYWWVVGLHCFWISGYFEFVVYRRFCVWIQYSFVLLVCVDCVPVILLRGLYVCGSFIYVLICIVIFGLLGFGFGV